jgi:hypothetical protein
MKKPRTKILFKVKGEVVCEEISDLFLNQIDEMKWILAQECECMIDDIDVDIIEPKEAYSQYDVTPQGLIDFKDTNGKILTGIQRFVTTDTFLESIKNGNVDECLKFM